MISLIAAIGKNRELGKDNKLLWHLPEDLKRFKELTNGHPIIMGRKTFESIGRILPNRLNIVITRDTDYKVDGAVVVNSLDEALRESSKYYVARSKSQGEKNVPATNYKLRATDENEVFIIGGGQIFEQAMDMADKLYLTIVEREYEADTYFPEYDKFSHVANEKKSSYDDVRYTFLDLEKPRMHRQAKR